MSRRYPFPLNRLAALAAMAALALPAARAANVPQGPNETVCPNPAFGEMPDDAIGDVITPLLTGTPIGPGQTVATEGTNPSESPELSDELLRQFSRTFAFDGGGTVVSGKVIQQIKRGTDDRCKSEWVIRVSAGCVVSLRIGNFLHPAPIVADYRDDLGGLIGSDVAARSGGTGTSFRFNLPTPVCSGQSSRPLLLNTSIRRMVKKGTVQVEATGGVLSPPLPTFVPK